MNLIDCDNEEKIIKNIIDIINDTMLAIKKCTVIIILKEFVCIDINVSYGIARHCTTFRCKFNIRIRRDTAFFVT